MVIPHQLLTRGIQKTDTQMAKAIVISILNNWGHLFLPSSLIVLQRQLKSFIRSLCAASIALSLFHPLPGLAQTRLIVGGKTFIPDDKGKQWLEEGKRLSEVNSDVVTVRFRLDAKMASPEAAVRDFGTKIKRQNKLGFYDIGVPPGKTAVGFVEELLKDPRIESAEVNTYGEYLQVFPNDPRFNEQWNLNNIG